MFQCNLPLPSGISIHALREERDVLRGDEFNSIMEFQSTRSARSATRVIWISGRIVRFQSTRSARSATLLTRCRSQTIKISIHALREERDDMRVWMRTANWRISIHALREERDPTKIREHIRIRQISIHALREERDGVGFS